MKYYILWVLTWDNTHMQTIYTVYINYFIKYYLETVKIKYNIKYYINYSLKIKWYIFYTLPW